MDENQKFKKIWKNFSEKEKRKITFLNKALENKNQKSNLSKETLKFKKYLSEKSKEYLKENPEFENICVEFYEFVKEILNFYENQNHIKKFSNCDNKPEDCVLIVENLNQILEDSEDGVRKIFKINKNVGELTLILSKGELEF